MRTPRRLLKLASLIPALIVITLLAGCVRVNRTLVLNPDGSGTYTLTIGILEPHPGDPSSVSPQLVAAMEAFGAHVQRQGGTYERFADQTYVYWTYARPFSQISEADTLVEADPRQDDPKHAPVLFHDVLGISQAAGPDGTNYHVTGSISLADPQSTNTAWRDATESLAITMTGGISGQHGGMLTGDTVTYVIHYNESAAIDVTGDVRATSTSALASSLRFVLVGVLLTIAVALAGLGGWLLRGPRRASRAVM